MPSPPPMTVLIVNIAKYNRLVRMAGVYDYSVLPITLECKTVFEISTASNSA